MSIKGSLKYLWRDVKRKLRGQKELNRKEFARLDTPSTRNAMLLDPFGNKHHYQSARKRASFLSKGPIDIKATNPGDPDDKVTFPWLHGQWDHHKGARWDFDPLAVRSMGEEMPLTEAANDTIVMAVSQIPWQITEVEDVDEVNKRQKMSLHDRPLKKASDDERAEQLTKLLMNPDPDNDWTDMIENLISSWLFVGSHPIIKVYGKDQNVFDNNGEYRFRGRPPGEHPIPMRLRPTADPITFTKEYDENGLICGYWQWAVPISGRSYHAAQRPTYFNPEEVIWSDFKLRPWRRYGIPPTLEVLDILELLDLTIEQERLYFSKGTIPSGMVNLQGWAKDEAKDFQELLERDASGEPWKLLAIGGNGEPIDYVKFGYNFKELQFLERKKDYRKEVAMAFRIPESALGTKAEDVNRATAESEIDLKDEETVPFYLRKIERLLTQCLVVPCLGYTHVFEFNIGLTEDKRSTISSRVVNEYQAGLITLNEARRERGLPEVEGGDEFVPEPEPDIPMFSMSKNEPLRETGDWSQFSFQPSDVDSLKEQISEQVSALWDEILDDPEFINLIEEGTTEKSITGLMGKFRELLTAKEAFQTLSTILRTETAEVGEKAMSQAARELDLDYDPTGITQRLLERDMTFIDAYTDRMVEDIRETVAEGWNKGKSIGEITDDLRENQESFSDAQAERIARDQLQRATGEARNEFAMQHADELVEVWLTSRDGDRVRPAHQEMEGKWKRPNEKFRVNYDGKEVHERFPGDSKEGIQCRCDTLLRRIDEVDEKDHAGVI